MSHAPFQQQAPAGPIVRETSTYMSDPEAAQFCQVFSEGLSSGLSYSRIMDFLERKGLNKAVVSRLRFALLEEGLMLGEAFAKYGILDPAARKLVLVAEEQGEMPKAFASQRPVYQSRYDRKKMILFSWAEPLLILYFVLFVMRPIFGNIFNIFKDSGNSLGSVIVTAFNYSLLPMIMGLGVVFVFIMLGYAWLHTPVEFGAREVFARVWMRIPLLSRPGRLYSVSLFCRYLGTSLASGMNIYDSVYLAAEASNDPRMLDRIDDVLNSVEGGVSLSQSLSLIKALPDDILEYIDLGEETGRMGELLERSADKYEKLSIENYERYIKTMIFILRLALIFGFLIVGFIGLLESGGSSFTGAFG